MKMIETTMDKVNFELTGITWAKHDTSLPTRLSLTREAIRSQFPLSDEFRSELARGLEPIELGECIWAYLMATYKVEPTYFDFNDFGLRSLFPDLMPPASTTIN